MALGYQNNVEHALISKTQGRVVIPEPINHDEGNGTIYERDSGSRGFLKTKSNSLEFYGRAVQFLLAQKALKGIVEDVILQKRVKDESRLDERWRTVSEVYLDMAELRFDGDKADSGGVAKTKAVQGGLFKNIESRLNDRVDLVATESSDGTPILDDQGDKLPKLATVSVQLDNREIFLRSEATVEDGTLIKAVVSGGDNLNARCIPFKFNPNSDLGNLQDSIGDKLSAASNDYAKLTVDKQGNLTLFNSSNDKLLTLNGRVEIRIVDPDIGSLTLDLVIYENGIECDFKEKIQLDTTDPIQVGNVASFDFNDYQLEIKKGESFAIGILTDTVDGVHYEVYNTYLQITEDSVYPTTYTRAMTPLEMGNRILHLTTGRPNLLRSSLLEKGGKHEHRLLTQGFWVRNFPDVIKEGTDEERRIQFTTSLSEFLEHLEALEPIAWWVEHEGKKEVMRIESLKYTQQNFVGIKYGRFTGEENGNRRIAYIKAQKVKRQVLKDEYYGKVELGSKKGGNGYEEIFGLQSISGKAEWATVNAKKSNSVYSKLSPYRLGDVDVELPRRRQYVDFPDTDTKYDSDIMCLDCKKVGGNYYLKKWQDVFETAPKGIYRPDSAYNLEFTPRHFFETHSFVISTTLYKHRDAQVKFSSSNCNSSVISKKTGELELVEDGPIPHSELERPRIRETSVDLVLKVEQELEDMITGRTDGVPNWFGLVAVDTGQEIEYMRLVKVDTNKEGKHKLVEAYV